MFSLKERSLGLEKLTVHKWWRAQITKQLAGPVYPNNILINRGSYCVLQVGRRSLELRRSGLLFEIPLCIRVE